MQYSKFALVADQGKRLDSLRLNLWFLLHYVVYSVPRNGQIDRSSDWGRPRTCRPSRRTRRTRRENHQG